MDNEQNHNLLSDISDGKSNVNSLQFFHLKYNEELYIRRGRFRR